jgi:gas vesicle protein
MRLRSEIKHQRRKETMKTKNQEPQYEGNNFLSVVTGLLIGSLAGAGAMLLMAPQSGEKTRLQIQEKGIKLRDQTTGVMEGVMARVWLEQKKLTRDGRRKANELVQHGKALVRDQFDQLSETTKSWKK